MLPVSVRPGPTLLTEAVPPPLAAQLGDRGRRPQTRTFAHSLAMLTGTIAIRGARLLRALGYRQFSGPQRLGS